MNRIIGIDMGSSALKAVLYENGSFTDRFQTSAMTDEKAVEETVGRRIQVIRREKGFTQQELSEAVGISTNYLSDIERGKSSVRMDKLVAIINALECSADDVFADVIVCGYKVKASKLSQRLESLSPSDREKALAVLEALINKS